jgi:hypothetical protein
MTQCGDVGRQRADVHVLAARVDAAERAQRTGVFRNHRDLHEALLSGCPDQ